MLHILADDEILEGINALNFKRKDSWLWFIMG